MRNAQGNATTVTRRVHESSADRLELVTAVVCGDLNGHNARIYALVQAGIEAEAARSAVLKPLRRANLERSRRAEKETAAIHRAADKWLTPAKINGKTRRAWPRMLRQWLWSKERCRGYGLEERPSRRRISEALRTWTSPHGDVIPHASNGEQDNRTEGE